MKSLNRWENTLARRAVILVIFPFALIIFMVGGAWFGLENAVKDLWGVVLTGWKGSR